MKPRLPVRNSKTKTASYKGMVGAISILAVVGIISVFWSESTAERALERKTLVAAATTADGGSFDEMPLSDATAQPLERRTIANVDVLMQRPSEPPKGILFVGHGCSHSNTDWWPSTPETCPECIGLPEEQAIVNLALRHFQFLVVAISSEDRASKCWSGNDGPRVAAVLKELYQTEKSTSSHDKIPIIAFGASSGGGFVGKYLPESMVALEQPLDGFIAQIAAPKPSSTTLEKFPPVAVYVTMNRDTRTDAAAQQAVEKLRLENIPAKQIRVDALPLMPGFFHNRIPGYYSLEESKAMVDALDQAQYLDSQKYLSKDPRKSGWRDVLRPHVPVSKDGFVADASPVSEVMNVARAKHELTRDGVREAMDFILKAPSSTRSSALLI